MLDRDQELAQQLILDYVGVMKHFPTLQRAQQTFNNYNEMDPNTRMMVQMHESAWRKMAPWYEQLNGINVDKIPKADLNVNAGTRELQYIKTSEAIITKLYDIKQRAESINMNGVDSEMKKIMYYTINNTKDLDYVRDGMQNHLTVATGILSEQERCSVDLSGFMTTFGGTDLKAFDGEEDASAFIHKRYK